MDVVFSFYDIPCILILSSTIASTPSYCWPQITSIWIFPLPEWQVLEQFMDAMFDFSDSKKSKEGDQGLAPGSNLKRSLKAVQSHGVEVLKTTVCRNASAFQPSYNSRCLHVRLLLNTTTMQGGTVSQGGTAFNFHHSPCFALISFVASCKAAANRVYILTEVWPASLAWLNRTVQSDPELKSIKQQTLQTQCYWEKCMFPQKTAITTHRYRECLTSQKSQLGDGLEGPIPLHRYNSPVLSGDSYIGHKHARTHKEEQTDFTVYLHR